MASDSTNTDDHGVADLLRQVAARDNTSLTQEEQQEVSEMVKRVSKHNPAPTTTPEDEEQEPKASEWSGVAARNKWGKDWVNKFSSMQTNILKNPLSPRNTNAPDENTAPNQKPDIKQVFRGFTEKLKFNNNNNNDVDPAATESSTEDEAATPADATKPGRIKEVSEQLRKETQQKAQAIKENTQKTTQAIKENTQQMKEAFAKEAGHARDEIRKSFQESSRKTQAFFQRFGQGFSGLRNNKGPEPTQVTTASLDTAE